MADLPTTRDQLIEQAACALVRNADVIAALVKACKCCASSGYEPGGGAPYPSECRWCDHEPDRHGEAAMANLRGPVGHALGGLLADPEQHAAELEELRVLNRRMQRQVDRLPWRQRDYERARLELRKLNDAMLRKNRVLAKRTAERDALQARIDAAHALTEPHPLRHWDTQWPIRAALEGVSAAEYAGEEEVPGG